MIGSNQSERLSDERLDWLSAAPVFFLWAVGVMGPFFTGVSAVAIGVALALYVVRMFFITGFYHRYFAHRTYEMNRLMQFIAALAGCTAVQKGPLWWASHHRHHHQHSDQAEDVHSSKLRGFYWSHVGWILCRKFNRTNEAKVPDLLRFPELRWLDYGNNHLAPPLLLAWACYGLGYYLGEAWGTSGSQMLVLGFFTSTFCLSHGTFSINSLAHMLGTQRYATGDESRNQWFLALITLGEGWHNNHHHAPGREAQAETKREKWLDVTHWILVLMSKLGLISWRDSKPVSG